MPVGRWRKGGLRGCQAGRNECKEAAERGECFFTAAGSGWLGKSGKERRQRELRKAALVSKGSGSWGAGRGKRSGQRGQTVKRGGVTQAREGHV